MIKKIVSTALTAAMTVSVLASCSQQGTMDKSFVEEKISKYSSTVENSALTIFVDSNAENSGDGSEASPFKTIQEAQAKIRELKAGEGLPTGGITVFVKDGEYQLTEGLVFTSEDSGTEECPITYVSESEFGAKITGALLLSAEDFEPINEDEKSRLMVKSAAENIVKVDLAKYGLTSEDWGDYIISGSHHTGQFYEEYMDAYVGVEPYQNGSMIDVPVDAEAEVFIGDNVLQCARWPNEGWVHAKSIVYGGENAVYGGYGIRNPKGPILSVDSSVLDRVSKWSTHENIWSFGYISTTWADSRNKVVKFDNENNTVQFKYSETYLSEAGIKDQTTRWYFFNIFDELDTAGEFYIDRNNGILYIYKTEDFYSERIKMSTITDSLIELENASNLTFKGFLISETRGTGIYGTADNVTIDNCKICNIRVGGVQLYGDKLTVQNCEICNLGSFGIYLEGGDMETLTRSENLVYNNYIHDWARVVATSRYGVQVEGVGSLVAHNEICNAPHQAVLWHGPYHIMEYNEVYNVLLETADCGAFYSGRNLWSYGCEVRYNFIHDVGAEGAFATGIYWDDGLSGQKAYGNLLVNVASYAILIGGGRDCYVYNNVIINSGDSPIHHDARMRQYTMNYHNAWFSHIPTMCEELKPYLENETWMDAFPEYEGLILYNSSYDGDLDNPMLVANPTGAVYNNIAYLNIPEGAFDTDNIKNFFRYEFDLADYCDIYNNPIIYNDFSDFSGWHNGDYTMKENSKAKEKILDFELIPFDKMGRID